MSAAMLKSFAEHVGSVAEIIVVDDGSSLAYETQMQMSNMSIVRNESPLGFCKASDMALRNVRTPYAVLVDADVLFQPGDFAGGFEEFRRGSWAWVNFQQISFAGAKQASYEQPLMPPWVFAAGNQFFSRWQQLREESERGPKDRRIVPVEAVHS